MIRVHRRDLEPESEPGTRHRLAKWRMTDRAAEARHPMGAVPEPQGGITAIPHYGGLHGGRTHVGANQTSMWCVCRLCEVRTPTVIYKDVCCTNCYRLPPGGQRSGEMMNNCVWVKWARLAVQFIWIGQEHINNAVTANTRSLINDRERSNRFFDAAETIEQMIDLGYTTQQRDREWSLSPNMLEREQGDRVVIETRNFYLREIYFANRRVNRRAQTELEQGVKRYTQFRLTTMPDEYWPIRQETLPKRNRHSIRK